MEKVHTRPIASHLPQQRNTHRTFTHITPNPPSSPTNLPTLYYLTPSTIHPIHPTLHYTTPHHTTLHYPLLRQTKPRTQTMADYTRHPSLAVLPYDNALQTTSTRIPPPHASGTRCTESSWSIPPKLLPSIQIPALQTFSSGDKTVTCSRTYTTLPSTIPPPRSTSPTTR